VIRNVAALRIFTNFLKNSKSEELVILILDLLKILSIVDSQFQTLFRTEEIISYLITKLQNTENSAIQEGIIVIL